MRPPAFPSPCQPPDTRIIPPFACRIDALLVGRFRPRSQHRTFPQDADRPSQRREAGATAGPDERTAEGEMTPRSTMKRESIAAAVSAPATLKCTSS